MALRRLLTEESPLHDGVRLCDLLPILALMGGVLLVKEFLWDGGSWLIGLAFLLVVVSVFATGRFIPSWTPNGSRDPGETS